MSKAHRHADVADAPVQQQGGQVWWRLSRSCPCTCCHSSRHTLVGVHLISHIECFRSQQLLNCRKGLVLLMLASSALRRHSTTSQAMMHSAATPAAVYAIVKLAKSDCQAIIHKEVFSVPGAYRVLWSRSLDHIRIGDAHGCHLPRR